jgi:hypothetical protein
MFITRRSKRFLVPLLGMGLMLVSLFGCLTLPALSVSGVEPTTYQDVRDHRDDWGHRDHWGSRHDRPYWRPRYALPDRYIIHKGKKCQIRCERIWGTRDYRCREYRC